jgi:drug/metabolite transporter (DMT)-like permease
VTSPSSPLRAARRANPALAGIGLMLLGVFIFSCNDALGKWMLTTYSVGQMLFVRSATALLLLLPFVVREGAKLWRQTPQPLMQLFRIALSTGEVVMFFWAVSYLPLADTITFYMAGPIYVTAFSAVFLGEMVGWRRWAAVVVGFVGVVITMRPSTAALSTPALIAFIGSVAYAGLMVVTRVVRGTSDIALAFSQVLGTLIFSGLIAPFSWKAAPAGDYLVLAFLGVSAMAALMCVNRSLKIAPASTVVPYQYTMIVWAIIFGYLVFGDVPDAAMLIGAAIIIGAGLFIYWREQIRHRAPEYAPPP